MGTENEIIYKNEDLTIYLNGNRVYYVVTDLFVPCPYNEV